MSGILGEIQKLYEWNWDAAERSYRRAIELDPDYSVAHHWYAQLLSILARHDEAHTEMEAARRCDPLSPTIAAFFSYAAFEARRYEAAVAAANDAIELDANAPLTHYMLGRAYAKLGDTANAIAALEKGIRLAGWLPVMEATLGYVYARAGAVHRPSRSSRRCGAGSSRSTCRRSIWLTSAWGSATRTVRWRSSRKGTALVRYEW
jgi:tetratricopeptide (TPR) repeat protein